MRVLLLLTLCLFPLATSAQDACETRCNQQASECLKACSGDSKDASKAENAKKLLECLQKCEKETEPCRQQCKKK